MDPNETMVESTEGQTAADDTLQESLTEVQDASESIESVLEESTQTEETADGSQPSQARKEPGYVKSRIDAAVKKAVAETEARMQAQFDAQLAPFRERLIEQEAKELVQQGEFKSLDRAKEYLKLKQGLTPPSAGEDDEAPARNERGQFTSKNDTATDVRNKLLAKQAVKIKANRGIDVMAEFNANEEVRTKVLSGEWDFHDVADSLAERKSSKPKAPPPMRSSNGAGGSERSAIATMSDEQFKRFNQKLEEGVRYKV